MKRYTLTLGAGTSTGGKVISASGFGSIHGVQIALEGDAIYCPACKSNGEILCIGPRIPESWGGKQVGLSGDLCQCGCPSPPRLNANQRVRYQSLDEPVATPAASTATPFAHQLSNEEPDTLPIRFLHEHDGSPIAGQPYRLEFPGKVVKGVTDAQGYTQPVTAADRAASIAWHVSGPESA